jgi:threonine 3-dehydrogenase
MGAETRQNPRAVMAVGHEFAGHDRSEIGSNVHRPQARRPSSAAKATSSAAAAATVSPDAAICAPIPAGRRRQSPRLRSPSISASPPSNVWRHRDTHFRSRWSSWRSSIPSATPTHTALSFPVVGEDVLITGAGPIGIMASGDRAPRAARGYVVITDVNPARLEFARRFGVTLKPLDASRETLTVEDVQKQLGMREGFDVGLEMSGNGLARCAT